MVEEMEWKLLVHIGYALTCIVDMWVIADFTKHRFKPCIGNKYVYKVLYPIAAAVLFLVNLLEIPRLNLLASAALAGIAGIFYDADGKRRGYVIVQTMLIIFLLGICESVGFFVTAGMLKLLMAEAVDSSQGQFFYVVSSLIFTIMLYRLAVSKALQKKRVEHINSRQYFIYAFVSVFSMLNITALAPSGEGLYFNAKGIAIICNALILLFLNLYISNLIGYLSENSGLKMKIELLNQRSTLQEEHFIALDKRYEMALKVLHDVKKHIRVITGLYGQHEEEKAISYTQEISGMLTPLLLVWYVSDHILNTILNDKVTLGTEKGIRFDIHAEDRNLDFMKQIDITTLFGNLFDNAMEACGSTEGEKRIFFSMRERNGVLFLRLENTRSGTILWDKKGFPVSQKGEGHGIGLENIRNIVEKYQGDMVLDETKDRFICNISMKM